MVKIPVFRYCDFAPNLRCVQRKLPDWMKLIDKSIINDVFRTIMTVNERWNHVSRDYFYNFFKLKKKWKLFYCLKEEHEKSTLRHDLFFSRYYFCHLFYHLNSEFHIINYKALNHPIKIYLVGLFIRWSRLYTAGYQTNIFTRGFFFSCISLNYIFRRHGFFLSLLPARWQTMCQSLPLWIFIRCQ